MEPFPLLVHTAQPRHVLTLWESWLHLLLYSLWISGEGPWAAAGSITAPGSGWAGGMLQKRSPASLAAELGSPILCTGSAGAATCPKSTSQVSHSPEQQWPVFLTLCFWESCSCLISSGLDDEAGSRLPAPGLISTANAVLETEEFILFLTNVSLGL